MIFIGTGEADRPLKQCHADFARREAPRLITNIEGYQEALTRTSHDKVDASTQCEVGEPVAIVLNITARVKRHVEYRWH